MQTASLDLGTVWRTAWHTFIARALPMLGFAFMGCAATWALALFAITPDLSMGAVLQMIAGTLALSFAQGGITCLALHSSGASAGFVAACHAAFRRWPTLLFGSLIYSIVIMVGAIGVGLALRYVRIHVPPMVRIPYPYTMNWKMHGFATNAAHSFVTQSASALIPDPGAPFGAWLPTLRAVAFLHEVEVEADTRAVIQVSGSIYSVVSIYTPDQGEFWWITAGSVTLLLVAEILLRLRMAFVMGVDRPLRFTPLWRGLCFSIKHFGIIAVHVWMLRLCIFAFSLLFIIVPIALVQEIVLPKLLLSQSWLWSWSSARPLIQQATALCLAFTSAILNAFSIAYDARLYLHLAARADAVVACQPAQFRMLRSYEDCSCSLGMLEKKHIERLLKQPPRGCDIYVQDEAELSLFPPLTRMWMPRGQQRRVPAPGVSGGIGVVRSLTITTTA